MKKLIALVAALVMVSSFAYAADWNFYGSARVTTFMMDVDNPGTAVDTKNLTHGLQQNSRVGANVKVSDELSGRFEFGSGQSLDDDAVRTRLIYGTWNFGSGDLTIGQAYSPFNLFYSNQVAGPLSPFTMNTTDNASDMGLLPYGGIYTGRQPLVQLGFAGFKIALVRPIGASIPAGAPATTYVETKMPKIEASYTLNLDPVSLSLAGAYNKSDLEAPGLSGISVTSYAVALGAKANFGAFYLAGDVYQGQNVDGLGMWTATAAGNDINAANTDTLDNDTLGYILVAGVKLNDMVGFEAGYGKIKSSLDLAVADDEASSYYINAPITLAPGVLIVPEIGVADLDKNAANADEASVLYYGLKWQINF